MKTLVFILVLLFPNGTTQTISNVVEACPPTELVNDYWEEQKRQEHISAWNAGCFDVPLIKGEPT